MSDGYWIDYLSYDLGDGKGKVAWSCRGDSPLAWLATADRIAVLRAWRDTLLTGGAIAIPEHVTFSIVVEEDQDDLR